MTETTGDRDNVSSELVTETFTVGVEGATLAGEARGGKPELVLLHGFGGEMHDWDRLWKALPPNQPMLRYDLRGFGRSFTQDRPFRHADDLLHMLDVRGVEQIAVAGVSAGGGFALNFALSHPDRVTRLVLISPHVLAWEMSDEWKALWGVITSAARSGDMSRARRLWWEHPLFEITRSGDAADELKRGIDAYHGHQWIKDYQLDELPDVDRLHSLSMPTLLLSGEHDMPDLRLIADVLEAAAPGVARVDCAGAGHMLHLERAQTVARAMEEFLGWN